MLLDDMERLLDDGGFGDALYIGLLPSNASANCTLVTQYPGSPPARTSAGVAYELPRIQVMVRHTSYRLAADRIERIKQYLDGQTEVTIDQTKYLWIHALSEPFLIGRDEIGRPKLGCNFEIVKERMVL